MRYGHHCRHRGFVAIISTITLSYVLTTLALFASASGIRALLNTMATEDSWVAAHYARTCAAIAILSLAQHDENISPGVTLTNPHVPPQSSCTIESMELQDELIRVVVKGYSGSSIRKQALWVRILTTQVPIIERWEAL